MKKYDEINKKEINKLFKKIKNKTNIKVKEISRKNK